MSIASPTAATPATVGLWLEFDAAGPPPLVGDARIRHARGLVTGLDAIPAVTTILLPCLPTEADVMARLFADAARPGRLLSDKLRVVAVGRDPAVRRALLAWAERRRKVCRDRLAGLGATGSPRSWRAAVRRLAEESPRRMLARPRRLFKLAKLALRLQVARAVLAAARRLPSPQATVVAELRRRGLEATWIVLPAGTECAQRLPGTKILDLGGVIPPAAAGRAVVGRLARAATAVVVPSRHAADRVADVLSGRSGAVVPPAPLPAHIEPAGPEESRRLLGDELRGIFLGDAAMPLHRHFCDFPFERVEYLVAAVPKGEPDGLLPAYAAVLRRHRRDLKLLIDGRLPPGDGVLDAIESHGLSFDVARCAGLTEAGRGRLLRHARAVIVAEPDGGCLPAIFCEAVAAGTPVVLGRTPPVREVLTPDELAAAEYYDVAAAEDGLPAAILHVLDHREVVLDRQRAIVARLTSRGWREVVTAMLGFEPPAGGGTT